MLTRNMTGEGEFAYSCLENRHISFFRYIHPTPVHIWEVHITHIFHEMDHFLKFIEVISQVKKSDQYSKKSFI